jgi:hypothetical protein
MDHGRLKSSDLQIFTGRVFTVFKANLENDKDYMATWRRFNLDNARRSVQDYKCACI